MDLGSKLKALRQSKGITQKALADKLDISAGLYNKYEKYGVRPPYETLLRIANFYGVSVNHLLEEEIGSTNSFVLTTDFKTRINELRTSKNLSQEDLANMLCLEKSTISKWERGINYPNQNIQNMLADIFGVSVDYLLGRTESPVANAYVPDAVVSFDVLGKVAGGYGGSVEEISTGDRITLPIEMLGGRPATDYFVLQVKGNSMYPKILDGDKVLVLRTESVDSGTTAVVLYNGDEATIKKVFYENEQWVDLVPNNPEYEKRRIFAEDCDKFRVLGKAVRLIREI